MSKLRHAKAEGANALCRSTNHGMTKASKSTYTYALQWEFQAVKEVFARACVLRCRARKQKAVVPNTEAFKNRRYCAELPQSRAEMQNTASQKLLCGVHVKGEACKSRGCECPVPLDQS